MSRNGSGIYSLPAGNPVVTGTVISSTTQNNTLSDIATALTGSLAADGQTTPTANLPMGGFKLTGLAVGSSGADSARFDQVPVVATQAEQETASSTAVVVTPGRQQFHPSAAKGWVYVDSSGTVSASFNVSSVSDAGTGIAAVNWTTAFSSVNYVAVAMLLSGGNSVFAQSVQSTWASASQSRIDSINYATGSQVDPSRYCIVAFGDQ